MGAQQNKNSLLGLSSVSLNSQTSCLDAWRDTIAWSSMNKKNLLSTYQWHSRELHFQNSFSLGDHLLCLHPISKYISAAFQVGLGDPKVEFIASLGISGHDPLWSVSLWFPLGRSAQLFFFSPLSFFGYWIASAPHSGHRALPIIYDIFLLVRSSWKTCSYGNCCFQTEWLQLQNNFIKYAAAHISQ